MTANQKTANHKPQVLFLDQSEKKPESGFWTYDPTSKCIMPSFPASKYKEGRRVWSQVSDTSTQLTSPDKLFQSKRKYKFIQVNCDLQLKESKENLTMFSNSKIIMIILTFAQTPSCSSFLVFVWSAILDHVWCPRFAIQRYLLDCNFQTKWRATPAEK